MPKHRSTFGRDGRVFVSTDLEAPGAGSLSPSPVNGDQASGWTSSPRIPKQSLNPSPSWTGPTSTRTYSW